MELYEGEDGRLKERSHFFFFFLYSWWKQCSSQGLWKEEGHKMLIIDDRQFYFPPFQRSIATSFVSCTSDQVHQRVVSVCRCRETWKITYSLTLSGAFATGPPHNLAARQSRAVPTHARGTVLPLWLCSWDVSMFPRFLLLIAARSVKLYRI